MSSKDAYLHSGNGVQNSAENSTTKVSAHSPSVPSSQNFVQRQNTYPGQRHEEQTSSSYSNSQAHYAPQPNYSQADRNQYTQQPHRPQQPQYGQPQYGQPPQPQYGQPPQPQYGYPSGPSYQQCNQRVYPQQPQYQPQYVQQVTPSVYPAYIGPQVTVVHPTIPSMVVNPSVYPIQPQVVIQAPPVNMSGGYVSSSYGYNKYNDPNFHRRKRDKKILKAFGLH